MIAVNKNEKKSGEKEKIPIIDTLKPKKRLTKADKELIEVTQAVMDSIIRQRNTEIHHSEQSENFVLNQEVRDIIFDEVKVMKKIEESKNNNSNGNGNDSREEKKIPIIDTLKPKSV